MIISLATASVILLARSMTSKYAGSFANSLDVKSFLKSLLFSPYPVLLITSKPSPAEMSSNTCAIASTARFLTNSANSNSTGSRSFPRSVVVLSLGVFDPGAGIVVLLPIGVILNMTSTTRLALKRSVSCISFAIR